MFQSGAVYYDTYQWRFLREKINSDFFKTKIRLRWYADIDTEEAGESVFLEVKRKAGACRKKERFDTSFSGSRLSQIPLEHPDLLEVRSYLCDCGVVTAEPVWPVFVISYRRRRYIEPVTQSRLCLDYDICVPQVNPIFMRSARRICLRHAVFEMKGNLRELPVSLHPLISLGCRKEAFSKYSVCYQHITGVSL
ncbi:MAG: VTC domain-containing protein [Phycisphaerae bacterium]|nr:VTC domain-containing protein [Phycisphaerae bacterium]